MELDPTDVAILRCLQAEARLSLREVAKRIGVSTPTVSARLAALERLGIIRGYRADLDPRHLEETCFTLVVRTEMPATDRVAQALARFPWARRVTVARSGRILVDGTALDPRELDAALEAVAALPGVVEVDDYVAVRTVKEEPRAILADRAATPLSCFECRGPIAGAPVKHRIDGRTAYFCCRSCERLYLERYARIKERAAAPRGPSERPRKGAP